MIIVFLAFIATSALYISKKTANLPITALNSALLSGLFFGSSEIFGRLRREKDSYNSLLGGLTTGYILNRLNPSSLSRPRMMFLWGGLGFVGDVVLTEAADIFGFRNSEVEDKKSIFSAFITRNPMKQIKIKEMHPNDPDCISNNNQYRLNPDGKANSKQVVNPEAE